MKTFLHPKYFLAEIMVPSLMDSATSLNILKSNATLLYGWIFLERTQNFRFLNLFECIWVELYAWECSCHQWLKEGTESHGAGVTGSWETPSCRCWKLWWCWREYRVFLPPSFLSSPYPKLRWDPRVAHPKAKLRPTVGNNYIFTKDFIESNSCTIQFTQLNVYLICP